MSQETYLSRFDCTKCLYGDIWCVISSRWVCLRSSVLAQWDKELWLHPLKLEASSTSSPSLPFSPLPQFRSNKCAALLLVLPLLPVPTALPADTSVCGMHVYCLLCLCSRVCVFVYHRVTDTDCDSLTTQFRLFSLLPIHPHPPARTPLTIPFSKKANKRKEIKSKKH